MKLVIICTTEFTDSLAVSMVFCIPPVLIFAASLKFLAASFDSLPILANELPILDATPPRSCNCDKLSTEVPS